MSHILIADDHPLFREAIRAALSAYIEADRFLEADSLDSMVSVIESHPDIHLVLLDLNMPGAEFFNGLKTVKSLRPDLPVAIVSASESQEVVAQAMVLGASGFIPKSTPTKTIVDAIDSISQGQTWLPDGLKDAINNINDELKDMLKRFSELTPKQVQVLAYLRTGLMNKQIAFEMNVTEATIKAHTSAILKKLDVNTRTQAVLLLDKLELG